MEKYLKYKNKYLILKGGEFQLRPTFIDKIDSIIKHIKNIVYTRSINKGNFDSKNIINRLIFNILLYGGFIFRKETIIDGNTPTSRSLIDSNGIFFNNEPRITYILKENYIFNSSNPTEISCEVKKIIDLLKKYSNYYYDNNPEIFNYNNNNIPSKSVGDYNLNDLFCLLFMIIKDNSNSDRYFGILKQINHITILNENYIKFDFNIRYKIFLYHFNDNYLINKYPMNNASIFNTTPTINVHNLKNINFNKSTTYNKYFLFNIPNLIDASDEIFFENAEDPRLKDNKTLYLEYNQDDVNDFNLFINFCGNIVKINNLIKNMPDIFYIVKCCIPNSQIIDYNYNQVYVNPNNVVNRSIIKYQAINFDDRSIKERDGINKNIHYDEINLLSSYWDHPPGPKRECSKDTPSATLQCIYTPSLTDHAGFLVKLRNRFNVIKFLSLNISEYQEKKRIASMITDYNAYVYFNRIKDVLYLLIKILKKEDIEFCFVQELFKAHYNLEINLTYEKRDIIFTFIKNYLNLYDYDIKDVPYTNYNNIIYKKKYDVPSNNIISKEKFTSILIGNTSMCSVKFTSTEVDRSPSIIFYIICISATIFNTYDNCDEIIIIGDFNFKFIGTQLRMLDNIDIIYGPSVDHAIVIRRRLMKTYINSLRFDRIFSPIITYSRENLHIINNAAKLQAGTLSEELRHNLFTYTRVNFQQLDDITRLINGQQGQSLNRQLKNKYNYIIAIFYLSNYFLNNAGRIILSFREFDLRPFHDFSIARNLECIFSGEDDANNHSYLWNLMQFIHLLNL